jgi:hypothetical protein
MGGSSCMFKFFGSVMQREFSCVRFACSAQQHTSGTCGARMPGVVAAGKLGSWGGHGPPGRPPPWESAGGRHHKLSGVNSCCARCGVVSCSLLLLFTSRCERPLVLHLGISTTPLPRYSSSTQRLLPSCWASVGCGSWMLASM